MDVLRFLDWKFFPSLFWLVSNSLCKDSYLLWSAEQLSFIDPVLRRLQQVSQLDREQTREATDPHQDAQEVSYLSKVTHS